MLFRSAALIVWDEAPMSHKSQFRCVDRLLRDLLGRDIPFGGKTTLLGGDFRQCLPVVYGGNAAQQAAASVKCCYLWDEVKVLSLTENMRSTDPLFSQWLLDVGNGVIAPSIDFKDTGIRIVHEADDLIKCMFGGRITENTIRRDKHHVILCPNNQQADSINEKILAKLQTSEYYNCTIDYLMGDQHQQSIRLGFFLCLLV